MPVAVGDIVRITARLLLNGVSDVVNVYHFSVAVDTEPNDTQFMIQVALALDTLYTGVNSAISPLVTYISIEGQNISKGELLPSTAWPTLVAGTSGGDTLPEMNSFCVFHRTLKPRVRAAKFLPPGTEGSNVNGAISGPTTILLQAFGDALTSGLSTLTIGLAYVAFNRLLQTATVVTQAIVPTRFRTQRRRRLGVGS